MTKSLTRKEYKRRIKEIQQLCESYGLVRHFGNHGRSLNEIDYRYDSKYIESCGEIVRLWPDEDRSFIVLFNKLYDDGECYRWDSDSLSEPLKNKIKEIHPYPYIDNSLDLIYLYDYGMDLIKECIENAMNDMKKFDLNIKLKKIEKDFQ